jgi:hypothetical protein
LCLINVKYASRLSVVILYTENTSTFQQALIILLLQAQNNNVFSFLQNKAIHNFL